MKNVNLANKQEKHYVVLLTGTIDSGVYNNTGNRICNINERLSQYEKSITNYIKYSIFNIIVFAENSGYQFKSEMFEALAKSYGKRFEYIRCPSHVDETIQHGKSYGEAKIIEDALNMSKLLEEEECIYKLTGRIYLQNSKEICRTQCQSKNEFLVYESKKWCFTNIFKFSKQDYLSYWNKVYEQCDEKSGNDIERVFYRVLQQASQGGVNIGSFSVWPHFDGIQGPTLEPYSGKKVEQMLRSLLCKLGCFKFGTIPAKLLKL